MKITQIKQQVKKPDRVSVFVDGKYSFSLNLDQLLIEKLKKNDEIDEVRVKQLKKLSDEGKLRSKALEWLMGRPHSERELRDYLFKKKAEKELIELLVEEFKAKNYLNDEAFARWFYEGRIRKNKSTRAIANELRAKGVSPVTIQSIATDISEKFNISEQNYENFEKNSSDMVALVNLVNKLSARSRYQDELKLKRYLLSKGFSYEDINTVLKKFNNQ